MKTKGTKIVVDIAGIPEDLSLTTWARMIEDKILLLDVEDRSAKFNSFNVDDTEGYHGFTVYYKSKLTQQEYEDLVKKYDNE